MRNSSFQDDLKACPAHFRLCSGKFIGADASLKELVIRHRVGINLPVVYRALAFVRNENSGETGVSESGCVEVLSNGIVTGAAEERRGDATYPTFEADRL